MYVPMRDIIAIGASAGGVEALSRLVSGFPEGMPSAVFVVHIGTQPSSLPDILTSAGPLPETEVSVEEHETDLTSPEW